MLQAGGVPESLSINDALLSPHRLLGRAPTKRGAKEREQCRSTPHLQPLLCVGRRRALRLLRRLAEGVAELPRLPRLLRCLAERVLQLLRGLLLLLLLVAARRRRCGLTALLLRSEQALQQHLRCRAGAGRACGSCTQLQAYYSKASAVDVHSQKRSASEQAAPKCVPYDAAPRRDARISCPNAGHGVAPSPEAGMV